MKTNKTKQKAEKRKAGNKLTLRQMLAIVRRQPGTVVRALQAHEAEQIKKAR
jgi:hypothetical protein